MEKSLSTEVAPDYIASDYIAVEEYSAYVWEILRFVCLHIDAKWSYDTTNLKCIRYASLQV